MGGANNKLLDTTLKVDRDQDASTYALPHFSLLLLSLRVSGLDRLCPTHLHQSRYTKLY
jgi:hypothetical protein